MRLALVVGGCRQRFQGVGGRVNGFRFRGPALFSNIRFWNCEIQNLYRANIVRLLVQLVSARCVHYNTQISFENLRFIVLLKAWGALEDLVWGSKKFNKMMLQIYSKLWRTVQ